jgi:formylglycine-generating enzyme required for sulfatase activity
MKRMISGFLAVAVLILLTVDIPNAMSDDPVSLRSQAKQLSDKDIMVMLKKNNFFDKTKNKVGAFVNDFVDNGDGTVTDRVTGLMWQKEGSSEGMTWADAKEYVNKLNSAHFGGFSDWRLPTIEELASLIKSMRSKGIYINPIFSEKQQFCWSADTFAPDIAWYVSFKAGMIRHIYRFFYYVRAVRTIK